MSKIAFIEKKFRPESLKIIEQANMILLDYAKQGFKLSLRQLYYQFIARDLLPNSWKNDAGTKNHFRSYKNLGTLISDARQAGLVDWDRIEDRGRETVGLSHWSSPAHIVSIAAEQFRIDKWKDQPVHIEVMCEKDALSGVLIPVCNELDISLTANKGYSSSSTMFEIGQRLAYYGEKEKALCVIYLGDHDPSGIDMTRDVEDRLAMYSELGSGGIEVIRVALNFDQVQMWKPPENPAKESDARFKSYRREFGDSSWELDAVEPERLADLIRDVVEDRLDDDLWDAALEKEKKMKDDLLAFANTYGKGK